MDQKIVYEIDNTLDQLIRNAEAISNADLQALSETELEAFQKTQESLLHHLLALDQLMVKKTVATNGKTASTRIREKRMRFNDMACEYTPRLSEMQERKSILSKRKKKRFIDPRYSKTFCLVPNK